MSIIAIAARNAIVALLDGSPPYRPAPSKVVSTRQAMHCIKKRGVVTGHRKVAVSRMIPRAVAKLMAHRMNRAAGRWDGISDPGSKYRIAA